jgi:putative ABC transport system permease protein
MLKSYLKIVIRNIRRYKGYSLINISGLTVGITCFILIMLYIKYELSFDSFHKNSDRIYRVALHLPTWNYRGSTEFSKTTGALAPALMAEFPEVIYATRINGGSGAISYKRNSFNEEGIYADENFFNVFSHPLIVGDEETALKDPFSIVITEDLAKKYFGDEYPIGKIIRYDFNYDFKVTGVLKEIPGNSFLKFDFVYSFASISSMGSTNIDSWNVINYETHILLDKNVNYKDFEKKLISLVEKHHSYNSEESKPGYYLQPLKSIHLHSNLNFEVSTNSNIKYIYLFSSIAILILLIA